MNFLGFRTLKTAIGAVAAMILAKYLGLQYGVSAGIITILSIQSTKKQSIVMAYKRFLATLLALFISSVVFIIFGFNIAMFGLYLLIFIPLTVRLNISDGIVVSSVLVTHLLVDKNITIFGILNEIELMIVGAGVALILNLYMPSIERQLKEDKKSIEDLMKKIITNMAISLKTQSVSIDEENLYNKLEKTLKEAEKRAHSNLDNYLFGDVKDYVEYIEMRSNQFQIMVNMRKHFNRLFKTFHQTNLIADFTNWVGQVIGEDLPVEYMLMDLETLREDLKDQSLPKTREEFENRAMLYQYLNDMEQFLEIKERYYKEDKLRRL
ncbi:aromatic acid exporter family protein [Clostridium fallax]|uniref:Uncharacterized membrane protein YgaE, UPF0421/DUF939 family n=1 Tax=Clostridium fallax TaxID=1533 RepID=A0A1M4Y1I4_9CLOT|nr:aromatic acid exporter family protein [Clostridium fallax]SHE99565.1 Uncharacterized membrane protein YgaE, UPF0421/DUF939 family [Clostridium fallax]SQB07772.1 integral membrane protein [Clostridium fallax]